MWPLLLQLQFPGLRLPWDARELAGFVPLVRTPPAPFLSPGFAQGPQVSPCPGAASPSAWSPWAALPGNRAAPALAAQCLGELDEPQPGSFTQPQRHLLLSQISAGSEVPGQISTCFPQRGSSPECIFCWKLPGAFLLENSFSRWGSFDAHTGRTTRSSFTPRWSLLSPHPEIPLAIPFGPDCPFPCPGSA